jgi:ribosomal protein L24E
MGNIIVRRDPDSTSWTGVIENEERTWILFVNADGTTKFYPNRDETGAVIESH